MKISSNGLSKPLIEKLFRELNEELRRLNASGEVYLVGGAVMCLVLNTRPSTKDVDAYFKPKELIREAAKNVAEKNLLNESWLNDAVKSFLGENGEFNTFLELSHLKIFTAVPEYLLAMKCLAMRLGLEFRDEEDVRYLLRYLNIETYEQAVGVIVRYYPLEKFPQKTLYALEEILQS